MRAFLARTGDFGYPDFHRIMRYVRGPQDEAQRLQAFDVLMGDPAPPLKPEVIALHADAGGLRRPARHVLRARPGVV